MGSLCFLFGSANILRGFGSSQASPLGYELRFRTFLAFSGFVNIWQVSRFFLGFTMGPTGPPSGFFS